MDRKFRAARIWSNNELKKYASSFHGSIVNVSGWKDDDKQGSKYKNYFTNATSYSITNYGGTRGKSESTDTEEYQLDLTDNLSQDFIGKFDVCFNHTTLEHIYDCRKAFNNLCKIAKEVCIIVVPWMQEVHVTDSFSDFWRFSPYAIEKMFHENGYRMVVCNYNNDIDTAVYLFCIGIRNEILKKYPHFEEVILKNNFPAGEWLGRKTIIQQFIKKFKKLFCRTA